MRPEVVKAPSLSVQQQVRRLDFERGHGAVVGYSSPILLIIARKFQILLAGSNFEFLVMKKKV